ncbi:ACP S-malonyltransferase [Pengzhenrongella sp.]|jgi:malonate decarboxylase epsilon subunit|uniref:ACP S-malonyltransferase n=1 Tax=Pengzhenrongella sp. TaxID=2888820 RepID=UPI002F93DA04
MTMTAVLFPGQGEQRPGMLHDLPAEGREVLDTARGALPDEPLSLDAVDALNDTRATQLSLLLAGTAWYRAAVRLNLRADYLAGHSIGLWTAAVAAECLSLADAVRLVDLRATAMRAASPPGSGMLIVQGLAESAVEAAAAQARAEGRQVWSSNVNSATQIAASGTEGGLDRLADLVRDAGAQGVVRLDVLVPAHSPLMEPAADRVREAVADITISRPRIPLAGNVTGQTLFTADAVRRELWRGIAHPVRWRDATSILAEREVTRWLQLPPGHALSRLASGCPEARTVAMGEIGLEESVRRMMR